MVGRLVESPDDELLTVCFVGVAVLVAGVAEELGVSDAIGAFMAGLILAESPVAHRIERLPPPWWRASAWAISWWRGGRRRGPVYAPQGTTPASHLERTLAADLATVAVGDAGVLDHSITRAHDTIADPWVRGSPSNAFSWPRSSSPTRRSRRSRCRCDARRPTSLPRLPAHG